MPFFDLFSKPTSVSRTQTTRPALTDTERAALDAIRRYELLVAPRIGDIKKRPRRQRTDEADREARRRIDELRRHFTVVNRDSWRVRLRFPVKVPGSIVRSFEETAATHVELKAIAPSKLALILQKSDPSEPRRLKDEKSYELTPVRSKVAQGRAAPKTDHVLKVSEVDSKFHIELPRTRLPSRLVGSTDINQGEAQRRLGQLKRRHGQRTRSAQAKSRDRGRRPEDDSRTE